MSNGRSDDRSEDWAPHDYTDGRQPGDWKTRYPDEARKWIWIEAWYLIVLSLAALTGFFYILYWLDHPLPSAAGADSTSSNGPPFMVCIGALISGVLGGCSFGIKWLYHSVAKAKWNEDRRLWRFLTPPLSGVVAMFMVFFIASGLLQIFDKEFIQRPLSILAFSFLFGYFSDRALAKMAELADTLLGGTDKGK